jgi:hypothetical protein
VRCDEKERKREAKRERRSDRKRVKGQEFSY